MVAPNQRTMASTTMTKTVIRFALIGLIASTVINGIEVFAQWHTVTSSKGPDLLWVVFVLFMLFMAVMFVGAFAMLGLIFKRTRKVSMQVVTVCVTYVIIAFVCLWLAGRARIYGINALAVRAQPIIQAINEYNEYHHQLPPSLHCLVPEFITSVPSTNIAAYPTFEYVKNDDAKEWDGNPWVLYVETPLGPFNWDMFMYLPNENYPNSGYGGRIERVSNWAYVHE